MAAIKRVAVVFNLKIEVQDGMPKDMYAEFDDISVPLAIKTALEKNNYMVDILEADERLYGRLVEGKYDFVFNIAEGIRGESRESHVPAMLEMLGIPYTGSGVLTQAITLDKKRTKETLIHHKIPTPKFQIFSSFNQVLREDMQFPLIVKPNTEGSSKGIRNKSLVCNEADLREMIRFVIENYNQDAIIEEFLEGREFTVSILGNNPPKLLPIVEVSFDGLPEGVNKFDSYEVKWIWDNPDNPIDSVICPAKISRALEKRLGEIALKCFEVLEIKDLCRIDFRLDSFGIPNVLEINALPGLIPNPAENSRFPKACFAAGMSYDEIINRVMDEAMGRYGLLHKPRIVFGEKIKKNGNKM